MKDLPHPKPFHSALWPHLDEIRKMRLARRSWPEIADKLRESGVRIDRSSVQKFFKRAQKSKVPLGFSDGVEPRTVQVSVQRVPSDLPMIGPDGKDPLLVEIPDDSPWLPVSRKRNAT